MAQPPTQVVLTFSERSRPVPGRVLVIGPDAARGPGRAGNGRAAMLVPLGADAPRGTYLVSFRSSRPTAIGRGSFTFSVAPSTPPSLSAPLPEANRLVTTAFPASGGSLRRPAALVGARSSSRCCAATLDPRGGPRDLGRAGLVSLATGGELALEVPYLPARLGDIRGADVRDVLSSRFGAAISSGSRPRGALVLLLR